MDSDIVQQANFVAANATEPDVEFLTMFMQALVELTSPRVMSPVSLRTLADCLLLLEDDSEKWPKKFKNAAFADMTLALLVGLSLGKQGYELP
jgi:hypothetical protein